MKCSKRIHNTETEANLYQIWYYLSKTDIDIIEAEELYRVYYCNPCEGWHITTQVKGNEMSNFDFEIKWDEPEELDESSSGGSFPSWGLLKLEAAKNVTLFAKGEKVTLPHLIIKGEPYKSRGAMRLGGSTKVFFFSLTGTNMKTGEPFTVVKEFSTMPQFEIKDISRYPHIFLYEKQRNILNEKGVVKVADWTNLQKPVMTTVLGSKLSLVKKDGLWVKAENTIYNSWESNRIGEDGKPELNYDKYWSDFTVFENEAAMNAVKSEEVVLTNGITYPWREKDVEAMLNYIADNITVDNINHAQITEWKLNGSEHVHAILKEAVERKTAELPEKIAINAAIDKLEQVPF